MKSIRQIICRSLPIATLLCFWVAAAQADAAPDPIRVIEELVQQDKYAEALVKVRELQKARPDDAKLKDMARELETLTAPPAAPPAKPAPESPAAPAKPTAPAAGEELSPFQQKLLQSTMDDAWNAEEDSPAQKKSLQQVLEQTAKLVQQSPNNLWVWTARAMAAMELNKTKEGWEAGRKMKQLGAENTTDEFTMKVLISLAKNGWLKTDEQLAEEAAKEAKEEERKKADEQRKKAEQERVAGQKKEAARKAAAHAASPEGIAERLRNQLLK